MSDDNILRVENLQTYFDTDAGTVKAVDGVDFEVGYGETVAVVGESGSGKTVTSESITKILDMPPGRIANGRVMFDGQDLTQLNGEELQEIRGERISHIFQNPQNGLNPVYEVGRQIGEVLRIHSDDMSDDEIRQEVIDLLDRTGIPEASSRVDDYPHEFSGGMKQRVLIAMALARDPDLLIADEPTTALDVTIQAQILRLLEDLQEEFGMSVIFVTHDLAVVSEIADRVVVMYAGKVMETGTTTEVLDSPSHPYTKALIGCLPGYGEAMQQIEGSLPDPIDPPNGCRFSPRCEYARDECHEGGQPDLHPVDGNPNHDASCIHYGPGGDPSVVKDDASGGSSGTRADGGQPLDASDTQTRGGDDQ